MRILIIVTVAALVLSGCNANQGVNLSSQAAPGVVAGPNFRDYDPYNRADQRLVWRRPKLPRGGPGKSR